MAASAPSYAFVTLLTSDAYLPGVLTVVGALRDLHPTPAVSPEVDFQTVCLVTPETVDVSAIKLLRGAFDVVVGVEVIAQEDDKGLKLLGRLDLNTVLTKLHVFRLTQYSKIIFLDADVLPVRPLSHLFTLPYEFSAVPDVGWPDIFNSGVLVLSPGEDKFNELNQLLKSKGTWDGGDQGILNEWRGGDWNKLSFTYNTTPTAVYTYAPAYERFGSQISAIHFIGPSKPWKSLPFRAPFQNYGTQPDSGPLQAYDYNALLDRWFAVYDKHCRAEPAVSKTDFEVKRYISAWDEQTGTASELISGSMASGTALGLEDLRKMATHGIPAAVPPSTSRSREGEYIRLPLEGRVDLMRPQKPPKEKIEEQEPRVQTESSGLTTPRPSHARSRSPPRWETLPTPGTDEVPPSPRIPTISLPPTPTPASYALRHHDQQPSQAGTQHPQHQPSHHQPPQHQPHDESTQQQHQQPPQQQHQQPPQQPLRPPSPPLLLWNAATDPPPTTAPSASAFPSDTYFPNIWDQPSTRQHYPQGPRSPSPPPPSDALFQPPPVSEIPESLRRQGHYRQVTGEDPEPGANPSPDRSKVKSIFPWEDKPRQMPGRVFPSGDVPSPSQFLSPVSTPEAASRARAQQLSPLHGLPAALAYANAWDTVPSIQKYASRLVRPPMSPVPLQPAFDDDRRRRGRSWDDRTEASSMDGDDEDEGDDEDDESQGRPSDSDRDTGATATSATSVRSRSGSSAVSATYSVKGKKKEYTVPSTREQRTARANDGRGRRQWAPSAADVLPPVTVRTGMGTAMMALSPSLASPSPGSPREFLSPKEQTQMQTQMSTPPPRTAAAAPAERHASNDGSLTSLTSPPSSVGPLSPPDAPLVLPPARKGSRVWDPARGVELFKRGSEEVLARFLKMGSWEDEAGQ